MHIADRVTASMSWRRCAPTAPTTTDLLVAGLLHDAGKGMIGVWPRVAYSLGQAYGSWIWRVAGLVPRFGSSVDRLRDHAETLGRPRRRRPAVRHGPWS